MNRQPSSPVAAERVGMAWFTTVRWTTVLAGAGAIAAGRSALDVPVPLAPAIGALLLCAASNIWLIWHIHRTPGHEPLTAAAVLMCADVGLLSWLLLRAGGVLNPASVFYLVEIVVAALVLGRRWTWVVTALSVAGYATLFLAPVEDLRAAQSMHPEIALHMRGMWLAFALTALIIAALVTRLAAAVERRDQALETLRERNARATRAAGLATLAAGAAHELSTPLATIAVAAHELERTLDAAGEDARRDARLIRSEIDRCRAILDAMAGRTGDPAGERPVAGRLADVVDSVRARMSAADWARVDVSVSPAVRIVWPVRVMARAIENLVQNALQASPAGDRVRLTAASADGHRAILSVIDRGAGMTPEQLARAGEPFFTTKPAGAGTGLGLFVTRSTVEQLNGSLTLTSSAGQGTTATIDLPLDIVASGAGHDA